MATIKKPAAKPAKKSTHPPAEELLSQRAYADHRGVSHTAVKRAIDSGRLAKSLVLMKNGTKKINKALADKEWVENTNPDHWSAKYSTNGGRNNAQPDPKADEKNPSLTLNHAKRAKAVFDAKLAELEYRKKAGELVEKKKVYETLYGYGKELRNELLAVPDRVIDEVLAAPNRNESLKLLYEELAKTLAKLTEFNDRELVTDR